MTTYSRDKERIQTEFENVCEYIARNPERAGLVEQDGYASYKYIGCLLPGYPEFEPTMDDYWPRYWRTYSYLRREGIIRA